MHKKLFATLLILTPFLLHAQQVNIIPQPVNIQLNNGSFIIDKNTSLTYNAANKELQSAAGFLVKAIQRVSGIQMPGNANKQKTIELKIAANTVLGEEGYEMQVKPTSILISANKKAGIIYGIQSLLQTLPAIRTNAKLEVPCMSITDYPRFKYRGMHLDVSRHFFGPEFIKEYIDLIASYKMNRFHWHLVDDQGWRIEIKKYPNLTNIGAWRVDHTDKIWGGRPQATQGEEANYGGYYTQEQIKDIIQYAADRNVTIIPEIEMPGHVASAIASYPHLSCTQKAQLPLSGGNYANMQSNYCAGNEEVFSFLQNVLDEVIQLFPSAYIHIGGDEVDKEPWKKCTKCQARIKKEGLKNEEELQSYFIKRIEKYLAGKKRKIIGWDEILEGGLAPDATVMSWRGEAGGVQAAKQKHDVIMTPGNPVYFDHYQADPATEPLAIGGFNTLRKVYDYEPIPKELNPDEAKYVMGAQANLWTEFVTTAEHVEYMILPRMLALSEVVWSQKQNKNWNNFNERLQQHFASFGQRGYHYCKGNFRVDIKPIAQNGQLSALLSTEAYKGEVYFTTDGTQPSLNSIKYTEPVKIEKSMTVKAVSVANGKIMSAIPAQQSFAMHKAVGKNVVYTYPVSNAYMADGPNSLTDGVRGTNIIGKFWHGISGKDLIASIDLGDTKEIKNISLGCLQNYGDWIFVPQSVKFEISTNGVDFTEVQSVKSQVPANERTAQFDFVANFPATQARYIRVTANKTFCPPGHGAEGKPGWIFADEIIVN